MGDKSGADGVFVGAPEGKRPLGRPRERDHLEDLGGDGRTILKWFFKK
jgi:hypothetical protein